MHRAAPRVCTVQTGLKFLAAAMSAAPGDRWRLMLRDTVRCACMGPAGGTQRFALYKLLEL